MPRGRGRARGGARPGVEGGMEALPPSPRDPLGGSVGQELRRALEEEPDVAYALLFGSGARRTLRPDSDIDVALELRPGAARDVSQLGRLAARLEGIAGRPVDLLLLEEAPPPVAYRAYRDGRVLFERDRAALVVRKARAIVEYLDFRPIEERCADGVLRAAARHG